MPALIEVKDVGVPQISLRDFEARREEIKEQLLTAATEVGFLWVAGALHTLLGTAASCALQSRS